MWTKLLALVLFSSVCLCSELHPNEDEIDKSQPTPLFLSLFKKSLKREIKNFTETGYRSEVYNKYVEEVGRMEVAGDMLVQKLNV